MIQLTHKVRDPIHGFIEFTTQEARIIDLPLFQRLRRIRQLAMAHLVYPGALHTRFDHSLGTVHIAGRIAAKLRQEKKISEEDERLIRLAMLLHDVGHGPFSHVSEGLLAKHANRNKVEQKWRGFGADLNKIHELVTLHIIQSDQGLRSILNKQGDIETIINILQDSKTRSVRRDIVSSSLDADKLDYLKRDAYYTGVQYGIYDLEKIVNSMVVENDHEYQALAIDESAVYAVEQLILAKHHMTMQVYRHKVRCITDAMIEEAINKAVEEGNDAVKGIYEYDGSDEWLNKYMLWHDELLLQEFSQDDRYPVSQEYFEMLRERRLFKRIFECRIDEIESSVTKDRFSQPSSNADFYADIRQQVAEAIGEQKEFVLVKHIGIKDPTFRSPGHKLTPEAVMVSTQKGLKKLNEIPYLLINQNTSQSSIEYVHIYARRDNWDSLSRSAKLKEYAKLQKTINKIIKL